MNKTGELFLGYFLSHWFYSEENFQALAVDGCFTRNWVDSESFMIVVIPGRSRSEAQAQAQAQTIESMPETCPVMRRLAPARRVDGQAWMLGSSPSMTKRRGMRQ